MTSGMAVTVVAKLDSHSVEWSPVSIATKTVRPTPTDLRIEQRHALQDDALVLLGRLDALPARALRQADPVRDLCERERGVLLQKRDDLSVDGIHIHIVSRRNDRATLPAHLCQPTASATPTRRERPWTITTSSKSGASRPASFAQQDSLYRFHAVARPCSRSTAPVDQPGRRASPAARVSHKVKARASRPADTTAGPASAADRAPRRRAGDRRGRRQVSDVVVHRPA